MAIPARSQWSVRLRITLIVALLVGATLSVAGLGFLKVVERALVSDVRRQSEVTLARVSESLQSGVLPPDTSLSVDRANETVVVTVADPSGPGAVVIRMSGPGALEWAGVRAPRSQLPARDLLPDGRAGRDYAVTEMPVDTPRGTVTLAGYAPLSTVRQSVDTVRGMLWIVVPTMVAGISALAWLLVGRSLRPVEAITNRVQEISATTLHERVPVPPTDDEVAHLTRTMNAMLDRLEDGARRQQQFVSDASHELRSPVASIRAQLEVALLRPDAADWPSVAEAALAEDERLQRIVADLLALARLDEGRLAPPADVDLDELVQAQASRVREERPDLEVDLAGVAPGRIRGHVAELTSVVRNLIENAARHAAGKVRLVVEGHDGWVRLVVEDDGPGIAPADRQRIFERFTRLEEGRSRDAGGTGLGLAVVQRAVEAHRGRVVVDDGPLGGARFIVDLPTG